MQTNHTQGDISPMPAGTSNRKLLKNGLDPAEMGRKGAAARVASTTPERRAEIARNAQAAMVAKHRKRLLRLSGEAIDKLYKVLTSSKDDAQIIAAVKTILDRAGLGPKSSIEIDQEINLTGAINHGFVPRSDLIDPDTLPLVLVQMVLACAHGGWQIPPEIETQIRESIRENGYFSPVSNIWSTEMQRSDDARQAKLKEHNSASMRETKLIGAGTTSGNGAPVESR